MSLYIGLMSGTSADGIDLAIIDTDGSEIKVKHTQSLPLPPELRTRILALYTPDTNEIDRLGEVDNALGYAFADAVNQALPRLNLQARDITAIGSHGQTVRHRPSGGTRSSFTLQIGNGHIIAEQTGITTITDFRRRDMACGGEGAPLAPALHRCAFASSIVNRCVINIGGIANITYLPTDGEVLGFDCGPGNGLMDAWVQRTKGLAYDREGLWAMQGQINDELLSTLMSDEFIQAQPPKSTGREHFCLPWLEQKLAHFTCTAGDIQATLLEFTARGITSHIEKYCDNTQEIYACGGGVHNTALMKRLSELVPGKTVLTTDALGVAADDVEAITFAWLAMRTIKGLSGNLPSVTGASKEVVLGAIYPA